VARFGGDEFVLIATEVQNLTDVTEIAERIVSRLSSPLPVEDQETTVWPGLFPPAGRGPGNHGLGEPRHRPLSRRRRFGRGASQERRRGDVSREGRRAQRVQLLPQGDERLDLLAVRDEVEARESGRAR